MQLSNVQLLYILTGCNSEYTTLDTAYRVWYTFREHAREGLLFVWAKSEVDDAIDLGKISEFQPHAGWDLKNPVTIDMMFNQT